MTLVYILGLVVLEGFLLFQLMRLAHVRSNSTVPTIFLQTIQSGLSLVFLTMKAFLLFGTVHADFLLGAAIVLTVSLVAGLGLQVLLQVMSADKNRRANMLLSLSNMAAHSRTNVLVLLLPAAINAGILLWAYFHVRPNGVIEADRIDFGMFIYFTLGAGAGILLAARDVTRLALDRTIGPVARNIVAIGSLVAWGAQAWRASYPLITFSPPVIWGVEITLPHVIAVVAALYALVVMIPVIVGARLYEEERANVHQNADTLLERAGLLGEVKLAPALLKTYRDQIAREIEDLMIGLFKKDRLQEIMAFWRWAPLPAFAITTIRGKEYLKLVEHWRSVQLAQEVDRHIIRDVIERRWFEELIGVEKQVPYLKQIGGLATTVRKEMPKWNYRTRTFDELVVVREELAGDDIQNASGIARLAKANISQLYRKSNGRSVLTAGYMAVLTILLPFVLSLYEEDLKDIRPGLLEQIPETLGGR
ncbi:hypothetical protein [Henriciella marina]|uniref:hypothetical protein n=1 Tax=Henriciella marina TaxID=453851 RepID=UPI0003617712|nr:hypothetical protein [Henriciella marina]